MRFFLNKFSAFAAIFAGIILFTGCPGVELSVSPSALTFEFDETTEKEVMVHTNAANWKIQNISEISWIVQPKRTEDIIYVRVLENEDTDNSRTGIITISASKRGKSASEDIFIEQQKKPKNTLSLSTNQLSYEANETGNKAVNITTDAPGWDANTTATWLQITKQSQSIVVNVPEQNRSSTARTADIIVTAGNADPVTLTVSQGEKHELSVDKTELTFESNLSNQTVIITTTAPNWSASITSGSNWLSTAINSNILTVTAQRNATSSSRTGSIRVSAGSADNVIISVTQNPDHMLAVSPTELVFDYNSTVPKYFDVETNVSTWDATKNTSDTWFSINKSGNRLTVTPLSSNNSNSDRSANIQFTAGNAAPVTVKVTQRGSSWPGSSNYMATGTPLEDSDLGYNFSTWTGEFIPNTTTTPPTRYEITRWATSSRSIYFDYNDGQFIINNYTKVVDDITGEWSGYLLWGTYDSSASFINIYTDRRIIPYNPTTRIFDPGTYEELPIVFVILPKNNITGEWDPKSYFFNVYSNIKITLTSTSSAPQTGRSAVDAGIEIKRLPSNIKVNIVERSTNNNLPQIIKK